LEINTAKETKQKRNDGNKTSHHQQQPIRTQKKMNEAALGPQTTEKEEA